MPDIRDHTRVLETITGPAEKRALLWLTARMPSRVTPDILTGLGLAGSAVMFAGYALSHISPAYLWLATFGLAVNWLGDSADGTLARVRRIERPRYGFYIDHTVDVASEAFVFLGLGVSPYVRLDVAALAFIGYLALSVAVYVRTCVDGVFRISYSRVGPTELRIVLVAANTAIFAWGNPAFEIAGRTLTLFDGVVGAVGITLACAFVATVLRGLGELKDVDRTAS